MNKRIIRKLPRQILLLIASFLLLISLPVSVYALDTQFYSGNNILYFDPESEACEPSAINPISNGSDVEQDFSLGDDATLRAPNLVRQLMQDYNLSDFQAAGIVGNFMEESGGHHLPPDVNEGGNAGPPAFSGGYGWAQWTGGRQRNFIQWSIQNGFIASNQDRATDAANYGFLKYELGGSESNTLPAVSAATNVDQATTEFEAKFERAGIPRIETRKQAARLVLNAVQNNTGLDSASGDSSGGSTSTGQGCSSGGGSTGGAVFDQVHFPLANPQQSVKNKNMFKNNTSDQGGHPYVAFDILANTGTPVLSLTPGRVAGTGRDRCPGNSIKIYNEEKDVTISYLHMSASFDVSIGDTVQPGTRLGTVGTDSQGCGIPHLHIDAVNGNIRPGCSRLSCTAEAKSKFIDIGPDLYRAFNANGAA